MKIGMRNVKTALAVSLSIAIAKLLKMEFPFYAAIAAIISMQNTVSGSFKAGRNRMLGTFVGALVGFLFALINPNSIILAGVGIIIVIYVCHSLKWNSSISIAGVVFCAIMTNLNGRDVFAYSYNRLFDTFLGITVAVLVNYFVFPPNCLNKIIKGSKNILTDVMDVIKIKIIDKKDVNLRDFYKKILHLEKVLEEYMNEFKIKKTDEIEIDKIKKIIELSRHTYYHLKMINKLEDTYLMNEENHNNLVKLYGFYNEKVENVKDDISVVFNYHLKKSIENIFDLKKIDINN